MEYLCGVVSLAMTCAIWCGGGKSVMGRGVDHSLTWTKIRCRGLRIDGKKHQLFEGASCDVPDRYQALCTCRGGRLKV